MNQLFQVGAKLLGLSIFIMNFISFISFFSADKFTVGSLISLLFYVTLIAFSLILIFCTSWLGSFLGISDSNDDLSFSSRSFLKVGIILIGLNHFLSSSRHIVDSAAFLLNNPLLPKIQLIGKMSNNLAPIILSLFLIFGSELILKLLGKLGTNFKQP